MRMKCERQAQRMKLKLDTAVATTGQSNKVTIHSTVRLSHLQLIGLLYRTMQ